MGREPDASKRRRYPDGVPGGKCSVRIASMLTAGVNGPRYFISTTWHGGGANVSRSPRLSATVQYCQPYVSVSS